MFWLNHLALREHEQIAHEYVNLKKHLSELYARNDVLEPNGKTAFVKHVLALAKASASKQRQAFAEEITP